MNNHKLYSKTIDGVEYKIFEYRNDSINDIKYINKLINKYDNIIIKIIDYDTFIPEDMIYHPYYNPGIDLYKLTYYNKGIIIKEYEQTSYDYIIEMRLKKINKIKDVYKKGDIF